MFINVLYFVFVFLTYLAFFVSSGRRHTRCALVTGVQTCDLPICRLVYARCRPSSRRTVRLAWKSAFRSVSFAQLRVYRWRLHPDRFGLEDTLRRPARRRAGDDGHLWLDLSPAISRLHTRDVWVSAATADASMEVHTSELPTLFLSSFAIFCLYKYL